MSVEGQSFYNGFSHFALDCDIRKKADLVVLGVCNPCLRKVGIEVVYDRVKLVKGLGVHIRHIRLHTVHIYPAEGEHSAQRKGGNAQRNNRRKPAAESGRMAFIVLFRAFLCADFKIVLAFCALVRHSRFTLSYAGFGFSLFSFNLCLTLFLNAFAAGFLALVL